MENIKYGKEGVIIDGQVSLFDQIIKRRKLKKDNDLNMAEVKTMIPDLKSKLNEMIFSDSTTGIFSQKNDYFPSYVGTCNERVFTTMCLSDGEKTSISLSAWAHKGQEKTTSPQSLKYRVNLDELDHYMMIIGEEVTLESKEKEFKDIGGGSSPSFLPKWSRPATVDDVQQYRKVVNVLSENMIFGADIDLFQRMV